MESTDVLVIGSGIAGLCAGIEAARAGATVTVASAGKTMSGSSFFPGTWGLGLIGPLDKEDEQDLIDTIQTVGAGAADPELVQTFVHGIPQAIQWLEQDLGVELQRPQSAESAQQKQFIPCFDHKHRDWNGIEFDSAREVFSRELREKNVTVLPRWEALRLVNTVFVDHIIVTDREPASIRAAGYIPEERWLLQKPGDRFLTGWLKGMQ